MGTREEQHLLVRDMNRLAGQLTQAAVANLTERSGWIQLGTERYEPLSDEELTSRGYSPDDGELVVLRRERDGVRFEVVFDIMVWLAREPENEGDAADDQPATA